MVVSSTLKSDNWQVEHFEKEVDDCIIQYGLVNNISVPVIVPVLVPLPLTLTLPVPVTVPVIVLLHN